MNFCLELLLKLQDITDVTPHSFGIQQMVSRGLWCTRNGIGATWLHHHGLDSDSGLSNSGSDSGDISARTRFEAVILCEMLMEIMLR